MKKVFYLLLVAPLLMAMQCDDDYDNSGFVTTYLIQNEAGTDLYFLSDSGNFTLIPDQSQLDIGSELNPETQAIPPSQNPSISQIRLYQMENQDFILVYEQNPLDDGLWEFDEPSQNRFEYTLRITEEELLP
ncbi:hypothetical protein [Robiginitalea sp. IMCC43444]|uniref:hypothetical protein n=1 Tax=Robiginitalea sp. IMCC43444 TaxID=3459121 RepID=UPI0040439244